MFKPNLSREDLLRLIEAGVQAPSADNRHVVRFELLPNAIRLWVDQETVAQAPRHRLAFFGLSFGAVIENIAIQAASSQWTCDVQANEKWQEDLQVATLTFSPSAEEARGDSLADAIYRRHTNRRLYRRSPIAANILNELADSVLRYPGTRIRWLDGPGPRKRALRLIRMAEAERFRRPALHSELFESIRFDHGWHTGSDEGLPPGALEIEPPFRGIFRALRHWPFQHVLNRFGAAAMLGWRAGWFPAWSAPHLGLVCYSGEQSAPWIRVGRAFQRLWLAATRLGVALQPMAASIALVTQRAEDGWVSAPLQARLVEIFSELAAGAHPCMVFRLGYARPSRILAGRKPVSAYLRRG
jgi:nitroreductase